MPCPQCLADGNDLRTRIAKKGRRRAPGSSGSRTSEDWIAGLKLWILRRCSHYGTLNICLRKNDRVFLNPYDPVTFNFQKQHCEHGTFLSPVK